MGNKVREWFYISLKMLPWLLVMVACVEHEAVIDQRVADNSVLIHGIQAEGKEWDAKYYNIIKRQDSTENGLKDYVTLTYFRSDNKIVKADIMWTMDRIYVLNGQVSMNTGKINGEHGK